MTDRKLFAAWVKWLRKRWRSSVPVVVKLAQRRDVWPGDCGYTQLNYSDGKLERATIYVNRSLPWETTQATLFHEWSHLLRGHIPCGDLDGDAGEKCPIFGSINHQIDASWRLERGQG